MQECLEPYPVLGSIYNIVDSQLCLLRILARSLSPSLPYSPLPLSLAHAFLKKQILSQKQIWRLQVEKAFTLSKRLPTVPLDLLFLSPGHLTASWDGGPLCGSSAHSVPPQSPQPSLELSSGWRLTIPALLGHLAPLSASHSASPPPLHL